MKASVIIIFYGGILYSLWIIYLLIKYKYGKRIKEYRQRQSELKQAYRVIQEAKERTALRFLEANRIEEVEVEEVPEAERPTKFSWSVQNHKRLGERFAETKLID